MKITPAPVCTTPASVSTTQGMMMHVTIKADDVTTLRHLVLGTCGDLVAFMRVQPLAHATKMKVWILATPPAIATLMHAVMCNLPSAEFGCVTAAN